MTEDGRVGWYHLLNGHKFEQAPGENEGQGILVCCSPWGHRVRHDLPTEQQVSQHYTGLNGVMWRSQRIWRTWKLRASSMHLLYYLY